MKRIFILLALLSTTLFQEANAQLYPVTISPTPGFVNMSVYLDDIYSAIDPKVSLIVNFNDLSVAQRDVYFKVKLTGNGANIETNPSIPAQSFSPTTLFSGVPLVLTGSDLEPLFNVNTLSITANNTSFNNNRRLNEGVYTLCFTVMDYTTNTPLSAETCMQLSMFLMDPPIIQLPQLGSVFTQIPSVPNVNPNSLLFTWMLANTNLSLNLSEIDYKITLYKVADSCVNPEYVIGNNQFDKIWESTSPLNNTFTYNYGISEPLLEVGKRYTFTVQAIENDPTRPLIDNNGVSSPYWFYYGYKEGGTISIELPDDGFQFKIATSGTFKWDKPNNVIPGQSVSYDIKMVEVDSTQTSEDALNLNSAFDAYTVPESVNESVSYLMTNAKLNTLKKMQKYAWQVVGKSGVQTVAKSPVYTFFGPPYLDGFYAANFYVEVVNLVAFDTITGEISGRGRARLKSGAEDYAEFNFNNIFLASQGNNFWTLNSGEIKDEIIFSPYSIPPASVTMNGNISFQPDSIHLTKDFMKLGGKMYWQLPLITQNNSPSVFESKHSFMELSSGSYLLASATPVQMAENETVALLEPYGFELTLDYSSEIAVYQSKYGTTLDGVIQLPSKVKDIDNSTLLLPFTNQNALHYMLENGQSSAPERIDFLSNADFGFRGKEYVIDLSETESPGDFIQDSVWKGVYFNVVDLMIPENGEESGQLSSNDELTVQLANTPIDSVTFFVDYSGLNAKANILFQSASQLYFNTFTSTNTTLNIEIVENEFESGSLIGGIYIPFLDTENVFNYTVPLTNFGFQIGNMDNSLVGYDFIHNAAGSDDEKVNMHVTRAVFKNKERIEFDLDAQWPKFDVALSNLQNLTAWGNGNIGFDIPNGAASLNNQVVAKSGEYEMVIDYVGCGRDQNAYAFGVSAKMNMAENISGVGGAPVVNAYSMYINPRLNGQFLGSGGGNGSILPGYNQGGTSAGAGADTTVSATTNAHLNNLNVTIGEFADSLGMNQADSSDNVLEDNFIKLGDIIDLVEIFIPFIDSSRQYKAKDYVAFGRETIESDAFKALTSKNPKEYMQDVLLDAVDGMIVKVNAPIVKATTKVTEKIEDLMTEYVKNPITKVIDTLLNKVFDEIEESTTSSIEDTVIKNTVKSIIVKVKTEVRYEIVTNIHKSLDTNITLPITGFIKGALSDQITSFIREQIKYVAEEFIREGINSDAKLTNIINDADTLFDQLKDTLIDGFKKGGSIKNIVSTGKSLVNDAFNNMDWSSVRDSILTYALKEGVSALVMAGMNQLFDNFDAGILSGLLNNVSFDFTNLGEKIESGDLTGIVKFDPTNIKITTKACDVLGQLKFTEDDVQYGDHWRANVAVTLKKPKREVPIIITALFITGKTNFSTPAITATVDTTSGPQFVDTSAYSYWFASLAVSGISIPLNPIPLKIVGMEGFAYHHMQRTSPTQTPIPCRDNKLGLGIAFDFFDCKNPTAPSNTDGKLLKLRAQLEVIINNEDWAMELYTLADFAHKSGSPGSYSEPIATATGLIGYYSNLKAFKGQIDVVFHTEPALCAGGTIKFNFDGINNTWEISAGTQAQPMYAKLLCKNWLAVTAFIEAKNTGLKAGVNLNIDIQAKSPWIDFGAVYVRGRAAFYVQLDAYLDVQFSPSFALLEASVELNLGASISVDHKVGSDGSISNFTVAGVALSGYGIYRAAPDGLLAGGLSGTVTVLGISCGLSINVNYDLGNQSDNS